MEEAACKICYLYERAAQAVREIIETYVQMWSKVPLRISYVLWDHRDEWLIQKQPRESWLCAQGFVLVIW